MNGWHCCNLRGLICKESTPPLKIRPEFFSYFTKETPLLFWDRGSIYKTLASRTTSLIMPLQVKSNQSNDLCIFVDARDHTYPYFILEKTFAHEELTLKRQLQLKGGTPIAQAVNWDCESILSIYPQKKTEPCSEKLRTRRMLDKSITVPNLHTVALHCRTRTTHLVNMNEPHGTHFHYIKNKIMTTAKCEVWRHLVLHNVFKNLITKNFTGEYHFL